MKQYNIYSGLTGSFGGASYRFTNFYENIDEAREDAFQEACDDYERYESRMFSWEDAINDYCKDNDINPEDLDEEDALDIEEYYNERREDWLEYYVVPTDEDNIDSKDLVLDYER